MHVTADSNMDGVVDSQDLSLWQAAYGVGAAGDADGDTDGHDFLMWQRQYGSGVSMLQAMSVPEPASLVSVLMVSTAFLRRNSRLAR